MPVAHPAVVARLQELQQQPEQADVYLDRWLRRFMATRERELRRQVMYECLCEADDGTLLGVILRLEARAKEGEANSRWLLTELALTPAVLFELPYDRLVDLYAAARDAELPQLAQRFLGAQSLRPNAPNEGNPHLDRPAGVRTTQARKGDRLELDRLRHDRDPRVIRALLDHPRLVEGDVIRIAAMRPTSAVILENIAAHPRWGQRYRVRKAIAFNPHTPPALSMQVLPTLLAQDLRELAGNIPLPPGARDPVPGLLRPPVGPEGNGDQD